MFGLISELAMPRFGLDQAEITSAFRAITSYRERSVVDTAPFALRLAVLCSPVHPCYAVYRPWDSDISTLGPNTSDSGSYIVYVIVKFELRYTCACRIYCRRTNRVVALEPYQSLQCARFINERYEVCHQKERLG